MTYADRHGDSLLASCKTVNINPAPETQTATLPVELPPFVPDAPPAGSGSGSGSGG
jgi:hypothetical protein